MDRNMDMRMQDGRNPYGSKGGYVVSSRGRRGRGRRDRTMHPTHDMRMAEMPRHEMPMHDYRSYDMRGGDYEMRGRDGHHPMEHGSTYYPIQAMGTFEGYYGMPNQQDYGYGRRDYEYDGRYDYAPRGHRGYSDYGYDYGYDYGEGDERLSEQELEHWCKKLKGQLDEREKQMFSKEMIIPKFKQMGIEMKDFNEEELYVMTLAKYTDHKQSIGQNPDLAIKLARDFMIDKDSKYKGGERVAVYYDDFVDD
jgi:hypothetical protein